MTQIRTAIFGDIPAIYALIVDAHRRSRLAQYPIDEKMVKGLLVNAIQRQGNQFLAVADGEDGIEGLIFGLLQPLYHGLAVMEATDVLWIARPGAKATTALRLLKAMHKWAEKSGAAVIRQGATDAIGDPDKAGRVLRGRGMRAVGRIYEKEVRP